MFLIDIYKMYDLKTIMSIFWDSRWDFQKFWWLVVHFMSEIKVGSLFVLSILLLSFHSLLIGLCNFIDLAYQWLYKCMGTWEQTRVILIQFGKLLDRFLFKCSEDNDKMRIYEMLFEEGHRLLSKWPTTYKNSK